MCLDCLIWPCLSYIRPHRAQASVNSALDEAREKGILTQKEAMHTPT
jgi:hypothetical protein